MPILEPAAAVAVIRRTSIFPLVAIDLETTGLDPDKCGIWEVGIAVHPPSLPYADTYTLSALPREDAQWSDRAREIYEAAQGEAPISAHLYSPEALRAELLHILSPTSLRYSPRAIIAHNAAFERAFLSALSPDFERLNWICTLELSRAIHALTPDAPKVKHNLASACERHGIPAPSPAHRAQPDAQATLALALALADLPYEASK